jgi:hypothetical protein
MPKSPQSNTAEKPFTISSWEDLRRELSSMKPRSKLFEIVKTEISKRGYWRRAPKKS